MIGFNQVLRNVLVPEQKSGTLPVKISYQIIKSVPLSLSLSLVKVVRIYLPCPVSYNQSVRVISNLSFLRESFTKTYPLIFIYQLSLTEGSVEYRDIK